MAEGALNGSGDGTSISLKKGINTVSVVLGAQWGDEGKGKMVDKLAVNANVICRCQVG